MPDRRKPLRRGEILGEVVGRNPATEADYFVRCPDCGGYIDIRDLAQVVEHAGPLPHPTGDKSWWAAASACRAAA
jgi:hypothetical protein